jgi:hypothetical protein
LSAALTLQHPSCIFRTYVRSAKVSKKSMKLGLF